MSFRVRCLCLVAIVSTASISAFAACAAPAQSGLNVCFPSVGSTVLYPATIELGVNSGNVPITHVSVYDNSRKVDDFSFLPGTLIDGAIKDGGHHLTVNAWDANGKLYQAKTTFTVTGFGVNNCPGVSSGINLCWPAAGSYQPENSVFAASFGTNVKSWSASLDGAAIIDSSQAGQGAITAEMNASAGSHKLVIRAVERNGTVASVTRQFNTFYDLNCNPKNGACTPGIAIVQPNGLSEGSAADVSTSFRVQADVQGNPKPTTKMIVYFDGKNIQQSAGPGITANVTTSKGSHYVVIQAWDTAGKLYETYGNVNVE